MVITYNPVMVMPSASAGLVNERRISRHWAHCWEIIKPNSPQILSLHHEE
jgi:hypothetical protein